MTRAVPARHVVYNLCVTLSGPISSWQSTSARALWMYRRPDDVARSAQVKWADHQRDVLRRIHVRDWTALRWRGERLSDDVLAAVDAHYTPDMTLESASVLYWWLRNRLFFELKLNENDRVLAVRYEPLVQEPATSFQAIFGFLGLSFKPEFVADVHAKSVQSGADQAVHPAIAEMAQELLVRLDERARPKP